ncbi:glutathione S-transferase family protein [Kordiimonas marina]|uniref:glutathione S-transferase family protein n=1 Tax=Kordiimonas marina TaxID=2872312 RepID=UPI001FF349F9|nr:glutathione S-transferase family protein [Kordiimonas marina]MCJ9430638.1 glutathione S-transferase family protein [Kordiimonas marina]
MITVTAYEWVPAFARGHVRDMRVRWALEEEGLDHQIKLISHADRRAPDNLARQPFGQVPSYEDEEVTLFESGAIVLHIAGKGTALMPSDAAERSQVTSWVVAALNSLEPMIGQLAEIDIFAAGEDWAVARRPAVEDMVRARLADLAAYLDGRTWLVGDSFTAADLVMACVLRTLGHTDLISATPVLADYLARCEARPAFQKALAAQLADFDDSKAVAMA